MAKAAVLTTLYPPSREHPPQVLEEARVEDKAPSGEDTPED